MYEQVIDSLYLGSQTDGLLNSSNARAKLNSLGLQLLYDNGLVTKSFKSPLSVVDSLDRKRTQIRLSNLIAAHLYKVVPALKHLIERSEAGVFQTTSANYAPPVLNHYNGRVQVPLIRYVDPAIATPKYSKAKRTLEKYVRMLDRNLAKMCGVPSTGLWSFTIARRSLGSTLVSYLTLEIEFGTASSGSFAAFMMVLTDMPTLVKIMKTISRVRLSERIPNVGLFGQ